MKQNCAIRLVQRKFAQGVPLPPSINVAPPAPERKPEPPKEDLRTVYHNGMSAASLLDIVAMQSICKHREPMVLLERLREDEIPAPVPVAPRLAVRRRRLAQKPKKKPIMRLRPRDAKPKQGARKRKSAGKAKGPNKKRPCPPSREEKLAEEDDVPLMYLTNNSNGKAAPPAIVAPTVAPTVAVSAPDDGFAFKRPSTSTVIKRKKFKRMRKLSTSSTGSSWSAVNRCPLPSPVPFSRLRRSTRLAGTPPPDVTARASRRPRIRKDTGKSKKKTPAPQRAETTDEPQPGPSTRSEAAMPPETDAIAPQSPVPSSPMPSSPIPSSPIPSSPIPSSPIVSRITRRMLRYKMNIIRMLDTPAPAEESPAPPSLVEETNASEQTKTEATEPVEEASVEAPELITEGNETDDGPGLESKPGSDSPVEIVAPQVNVVEEDESEPFNLRYEESEPAEGPAACPSNSYASVQAVMLAVKADCKALAARCRECRGCGIVAKIIRLMELMPATYAAAGDVYDFNAEIVEAICPSLSSLRSQSRLARVLEEDHLYMDLLPGNSPHVIQITMKSTAESQYISKACIVEREMMLAAPQPSLFEHEALLDRMLVSLTAAPLNQEREEARQPAGRPGPRQAAGRPEPRQAAGRPKPRSAARRQEAEQQDALHKALRDCSVDMSMQISDAPEYSSDAEPAQPTATGRVLEAPVFRPTAEEFKDPISYYEAIAPEASKYGLCKIVPPAGFSPPCVIDEGMRFAVIYQYIAKLYNRWGPASRELAAIKAHMKTQSVAIARSPLLDGTEVSLPKLHHSVQRHGGPTNVIQRKRWGRVAEEMRLTKLQNPERKLDQLFMRYLLPYTMLSNEERQKKLADVEKCWTRKYQKMLDRARNPFHRQRRMLGESESSEDEAEDGGAAEALHEAEDCIVQGRVMHLATFRKIAKSLMEAQLEPIAKARAAGGEAAVDAAAAEAAYWRAVLHGTEHIVANTASIDTGEEGYGFPKDPDADYGDHPWNLKRLSQNPKNVLRYLGPVLGVTVPTLHLGMLFSTSCWHRDPHGLPWTEFMHSGPEKIWYGIPSAQSANFRRAVETLCPAYCQSKSIWLASDIAMIPPDILSEHDVTLSRVTQRPGEYVMVFPEAHSCSIATGFAVSESVYFASLSWLDSVTRLFKELRDSCEPTMFSLEQLLMSGARSADAPRRLLPDVLAELIGTELAHRRQLQKLGLQMQVCKAEEDKQSQAWSARNQDECEFCRSSLYFSKVVGLTGKKSQVCPEHAIRLLESRKYGHVSPSALSYVTSHPTDKLQEAWDRLDDAF